MISMILSAFSWFPFVRAYLRSFSCHFLDWKLWWWLVVGGACSGGGGEGGRGGGKQELGLCVVAQQ